jgi:hypothetical protein
MCRDNDPRCLSCVTGRDALQASGAVLTTHWATNLLAHYFTFECWPILRVWRNFCALLRRLPRFPAAWSNSLTQKRWRPGNAFTWILITLRKGCVVLFADQLLFAVDREAKRSPETNRIHFPALFGKARDRCHASMVRWASQIISQVARECQASPREIEAALFMWGYRVAEEQEDSRCG